ncbi:MAG: carboxy-S-adenosyl-L-methionine synthase CmoA [Calditrichaeota bacterium]|nr:carboxy-S-adenosyl-L-methionine synthase CmoA [Calditrichota bacterium]
MNNKKPIKDNIYAKPLEQIGGFRFDENVARVFPDMIKRSVPGYEEILQAIGLFTAFHVQPDSNCYDLGSSLGAATVAMRQAVKAPNVTIFAVDNSIAMIKESQKYLLKSDSKTPVQLICADFRDVKINRASVVVLNYTLQFIHPSERRKALQKIYEGMLPGGILIISEKIVFPDPEEQQFQEAMHLSFKKARGYSKLEISQKRTALENVLIPETPEAHLSRLLEIGFNRCYQWYQYFNFISMVAIK